MMLDTPRSHPRRLPRPGARRAGLLLLLAAAVALPLGISVSRAAELTVVVFVHPSNPVAEMTADQVAKVFLKKTSRWSHGEKVLPVDLVEQSQVREAFSQQVHGKGTAAIKAYWQKMIFSGRDVPPPEKASISEAVAYVRSNRGGIGYAPAGMVLGDGVKVVTVKP